MFWPVVFVVKCKLMRMAAMAKKAYVIELLRDEADHVLEYLHKFKAICEPVLDVKFRHSDDQPFVSGTLRDCVDEFEQMLVSREYVENWAEGGWFASAFANVAGNLNPFVLKEAIEAFFSFTTSSAFYESMQRDACRSFDVIDTDLHRWVSEDSDHA